MRVTRQLVWTSLGALLALGLVSILLVPWVARSLLTSAAQTRGWQLQASSARVGLRGIWFDGVQVDWQREAVVRAELRAVRLGWSSLFGDRDVSVGSGNVRLTGTWEQLSKIREPKDGGAPASTSSRSTDYDVHDLTLEWRERDGGGPLVSLRNVDFERSSGNSSARILTFSARHHALSIELKDVKIAPASSKRTPSASAPVPTSTSVESPIQISAGELQIKYDASMVGDAVPAVAATSAAESGGTSPSTIPSSSPSLVAEREPHASASPRSKKGANSRASKSVIHSPETAGKKELLPVLASLMDKIERLRADIVAEAPGASESAASAWLRKVPVGTKFETDAFRVRIADAGQKLDLGPWPMRGERQSNELRLELAQVATTSQSALSAQLIVAERLESAKAKFSVGPIGLPQLGITDGDFGLENIATTELQLEAYAEFQAQTGLVSTESKGRVARLSIRQPFLARQTIRNIGFEWEGAATLDSSARKLKSEKLRFSVGRISATMSGAVELGREHHVVDGMLEVPLAACQDLFDALPEGLAPLLSGWRVNGTFATRSSVAFDSKLPHKSTVKVRIENACRVVSVPHEVAPARFEQPFVLEVENAQGIAEPSSFGPGTWGYVPLVAISPYIQSALLVCEDGGFLHHDGFDREAIQNSIRENLRTGRFARGASTISMQLAKNLYLRRDKTIARKLQEAALTMLLEQSLSKSQLLELYLNVIEFGPGLYGIGPAAKHYFATTPDRLTLAQSFFLISILPSPKQVFFAADGQVPAGRMRFLRTLMAIAHKRGHFTQAELDAGLEEQLAFGVPGNQPIAPSRWLLKDPRTGPDDDELELPDMPDE